MSLQDQLITGRCKHTPFTAGGVRTLGKSLPMAFSLSFLIRFTFVSVRFLLLSLRMNSLFFTASLVVTTDNDAKIKNVYILESSVRVLQSAPPGINRHEIYTEKTTNECHVQPGCRKKKQQPILYTHNETLEASLQYLTSSVLSPCGWQVTTPPEEGWNNTVVMAEGWWKAGSGRVQLLGSLLRFYRCIVVICAYGRACVGVCVLCTFVWKRISDSVNACIHTCITYDFHHEYSHFLNAFAHSQQPPNRTTNFLFQQTPCKRIIPIRQL